MLLVLVLAGLVILVERFMAARAEEGGPISLWRGLGARASADDPDLGVAGGHGVGIIFKKGELYKKVPEKELLETFLAEIDKMAAEKKN